MKFLIFLLAILMGVWLWRRNRLNDLNQHKPDSDPKQASQPSPSSPSPSPMLACEHCGVHMPEGDMVKGKKGIYCSSAHCLAAADQTH